jgi:raffinose/stachyose/melibiose transport system substrate-binding protein
MELQMKNKYNKVLLSAVVSMGLMASDLAMATDLNFWSWRQEDAKAYNEIIAEFEKSHSDINVTYTAHEAQSYNTVLTTALAGGSGPDIIHTRSYGSLEQIAAAGYLEPLDGQVDLSLIGADSLLGTTLRADKKVYAVPFATQTVFVYYNTDIFEKHKIAVPTTWDEFTAAADKLKSAGIIPLANGSADGWTMEIMSGAVMPSVYGKSFFGEVTSGQTDFNDARYISALNKMLELKQYMPDGFQGVDYATMVQLFLSGQSAMFIGGSWEAAGFKSGGVNFDFMPIPTENGDPGLVATFLDGGYGVNAASEKKEAALEFIRFTATKQFGQLLTDKLGNTSPIEGAVSNDPMLRKVGQLNKNATPYLMLVAYRFNKPTGSVLLQNGLQELFSGKKDAASVAKDINDGIKNSK